MGHRNTLLAGAVGAVVLLAVSGMARGEVVKIANGYHAQETPIYCGPASIQMMLDTPAVLNNYVNPVLPSQIALFNLAQPTNLEPWYTSPAGMVAGLNASDGGFHNYSVYSTATLNQNSRTIANALKDYNIPGSVLIKGGSIGWILMG